MLNFTEYVKLKSIPAERLTEEQKRQIAEYEEATERTAQEARERRAAERRAAEQEKQAAENCTMDWFMRQLQGQTPRAPRLTLEKFSAQLPQMIEQAYRLNVEKRGAEYLRDEQTQFLIHSVARWLSKRPKVGLRLSGNVGCGKTMMLLAMAAVWRLAAKQQVKIFSAEQLAEMALKDNDAFRKAKACPALFIDDLGTEPQTVKSWGNDISPLVELLSERYDKMLFTVITTNFGNEQILHFYGERIADRLKEMCNTLVCSSEHKSYRK